MQKSKYSLIIPLISNIQLQIIPIIALSFTSQFMKLRLLICFLIVFSGNDLFSQKHVVLHDSLIQVFPLNDKVKETSGLIFWNNLLWTHNDDSENILYGIHPASGAIEQQIAIRNLEVRDWEEIQHDQTYLYMGDIGNNYRGNRTDLRIFRKKKTTVQLDTIGFHYPEQTDFSIRKPNSTDFDCEAFIVTDSMIYLFTKEWNTQMTSLYKIPNQPGNHTAKKISSFNSNGLITGATRHPEKNLIILTGYSKTLQPFLYILLDFHNDDFLSGEKQRLKINKRFLQIESVAFIDSIKIAVTNENFSSSLIKSPQRLFIIDLRPFLD